MKVIFIRQCFEDCPHCTGPDHNREKMKFQFTCQEIPDWIEDANTIPDWCPLDDYKPRL